MAILKIITAPDPRLAIKAHAVSVVDDSIGKLLDDMLETMYACEGVGLAATQVGVDKRVIVMDCALNGEDPKPYKMVNPKIIDKSQSKCVNTEACLSVPEQQGDVERFESITVEYLDENGVMKQLQADGLLGICVQHEIDHLDGVLYIDHLSRLKKDIIVRKLKRIKSAQKL